LARTLDVQDMVTQDRLASEIATYYDEWNMYRHSWLDRQKEVREYVFATDTASTSNSVLPWKNSTHVPKLCQIRDNLHANYLAALKPNDDAIWWEGNNRDDDTKKKREVIRSYVANKLRSSGFWTEVSKLVYDWIDYGNTFAMTEYVAEFTVDPVTGEKIPGYVGPRLVRISPEDIVFNPTAASFDQSPKIIRSLRTLGSLRADIEDHPEMGYLSEVFNEMVQVRQRFDGLTERDFRKNSSYAVDGFTSFLHYMQSGYVEVLDFYGDIYDATEDKLYKNHLITVVDRSLIIRKKPNPSWFGRPNIFHCGWRLRPDNLYAMSPLENLIGMQYRIDHLENAKADAFDLIVHPVQKVRGFVEDYEYEPGARIFVGDDGDVEFMSPDVTMLNADTQIALYEQKMEEMAGAPKQAMGFRTPGEKTAYEVQVLENGSNRVFLNKTSYFEEMFLEPIINSMLELARRNISTSDIVRVTDDQYGAASFLTITKEDITAAGKIRPIGARHFARNSNIIQNLTQLASSAIGQDPSVNVHISGKKIAALVEELLGLQRYELVKDNVRVMENYETQNLLNAGKQSIMERGAVNETGMVQPPVQPQGQGVV